MRTRPEHDALGVIEVPAERLYGAGTARAAANFPFASPMPWPVIAAMARIKAAAARVNGRLGLLPSEVAASIARAADEIAGGALRDEFPLSVFQTGSGTSSNMNLNEVIANRCAQAAGQPLGGKRPAHPNDHVNLCQSSNDVFPSATQIAALIAIRDDLDPALLALAAALRRQAAANADVVTVARTHLQDATPIRYDQVFDAWAAQIDGARAALDDAARALCDLPLGGTAVGTGTARHPAFAPLVIADLGDALALPLREARDHVAAQGARDAVVQASAALRGIAIALSKVANDLRWLASGPRAGLGEVRLPAVQPGSSIMPGKVNPVICEAAIQACIQVVGNDAAIALAGLGGLGSLLQLNVAMPVMARNLVEQIDLMTVAARILAEKAVDGLVVDRARCADLVAKDLALCTALAAVIGYDRASELSKLALAEDRTIRDVALAAGVLPAEELDRLLDPRRMTEPGLGGGD
ncbi:MAG TPA: class II fumarate hydratase [Planctomycetota bacterium]|nr:class II fumarate hydratase [Planctomycetota bacterium]